MSVSRTRSFLFEVISCRTLNVNSWSRYFRFFWLSHNSIWRHTHLGFWRSLVHSIFTLLIATVYDTTVGDATAVVRSASCRRVIDDTQSSKVDKVLLTQTSYKHAGSSCRATPSESSAFSTSEGKRRARPHDQWWRTRVDWGLWLG